MDPPDYYSGRSKPYDVAELTSGISTLYARFCSELDNLQVAADSTQSLAPDPAHSNIKSKNENQAERGHENLNYLSAHQTTIMVSARPTSSIPAMPKILTKVASIRNTCSQK